MAVNEGNFARVGLGDIVVGQPLRWNLYNESREQICRQGQIFDSLEAIDALVSPGVYRLLSNAEKQSRDVAFDTSRIRVGDAIQLEVSPEQPRYVVFLIGYQKNKGIIVTPPESAGGLMMLRDGQSFVGRFFSGQRAFAFSTTLVRQTSVPFPHMHLAYPRDLRVQEVRKSPRIDVQMIAAIEFVDREAPQASGKICNLSATGAALRTKHRLAPIGEKVRLKFKLAIQGLETYLSVLCEIRSLADNRDDPAMPVLWGLSFVEPDSHAHFALSAYVYGMLLGEV